MTFVMSRAQECESLTKGRTSRPAIARAAEPAKTHAKSLECTRAPRQQQATVWMMQRSVGNRAVLRMLAGSRWCPSGVSASGPLIHRQQDEWVDTGAPQSNSFVEAEENQTPASEAAQSSFSHVDSPEILKIIRDAGGPVGPSAPGGPCDPDSVANYPPGTLDMCRKVAKGCLAWGTGGAIGGALGGFPGALIGFVGGCIGSVLSDVSDPNAVPHEPVPPALKGIRPVASAVAGIGTLRGGSSGAGVVAIQQQLNAAGAQPPLVVDGQFGPATVRAVIEFQKAHQLAADGVVGPETRRALQFVTEDFEP